jgi:hypothetical protein
MIHSFTTLHWAGVASAFAAYFILGALWFTVFFKKQYRVSLGKENEPEQKPAPIFIVGPAICSLVITLANALLMQALAFSSYASVLQFAFLVGIGYLFANTVNIAINPNIPKPLFYGLISGTYHLAGTVIACSLLYFMR